MKRLDRRAVLQLLAAAGGLGVLTPKSLFAQAQGDRPEPSRSPASSTRTPVPTAAVTDETATLLREFLVRRAVPITDPWVEAHVVLALGRDVERGGTRVLDDLVITTLAEKTIEGRKLPLFPLDVERHANHFLQIMQATDVPLDRSFKTPFGALTRAQLVEATKLATRPKPDDDELSWTVSVLTASCPPSNDRFKNVWGEEVSVAAIVEQHLVETENAYADTLASMTEKRPYGRGLLQTKACNGTHMLYGLIDALRAGYQGRDLRGRVEKLVDATLFRVKAEPLLIDKILGQKPSPFGGLNVDAAKFTFYGHVLEDFGHARRTGVWKLSAPQTDVVTLARDNLAEIVDRLTRGYDLDALSQSVPGAYKLILGDACHAYRGWTLWS